MEKEYDKLRFDVIAFHDSSGACDVFEIVTSTGRTSRRFNTRLLIEMKSVRISLSIDQECTQCIDEKAHIDEDKHEAKRDGDNAT
jgi:hypothetical protein